MNAIRSWGGAMLAAAWLVGAQAAPADGMQPGARHAHGPAKVELVIKGMFCDMCPITIRKALERLPYVKRARVSRKDERGWVEMTRSEMKDIQELVKTVDALGYMAYVARVERP